jgi:hypothetical protein
MGRSRRTAKAKHSPLSVSAPIKKQTSYEGPSTPSIEFRVGAPVQEAPVAPVAAPILIEDLGRDNPDVEAMKRYTLLFATSETYIKMFAAMQAARRFIPVVLVDVLLCYETRAGIKWQALYKMNPKDVTPELLKEFSDSDRVRAIPEARLQHLLSSNTLYDKGGVLKPFEVVVSVLQVNFY